MTPARAGAAPTPQAIIAAGDGGTGDDGGSDDGGSDGGGDGGFKNNGFIPWQGGPVITQLKVAAVFWGSNVDPLVVSDVAAFYATLTSGSFMHYVSEYSTPAQTPGAYGAVLGAFTIQPSNTASVLLDSDIITELSQQIASGVLPPNDPNTVFMVHLPPGVSIDDPSIGKSCVAGGFCAYHKSGSGIIYSLIPDFSQGGCAPGPPNCTGCCGDKSPFDTVTAISSHELMEAVTDPTPLENASWINVLLGENGDLCQYAKIGHGAYTTVYARNGRSYTAQKGWSNAAFLQHFGNNNVGCVDYPTTLCCNDAQTNCVWLPNGTATCPNPTGDNPNASTVPNGIVVTAPTLGGFGNATAQVTRQFVNRPPFPLGITDLLSSFGVQSPTMEIATDTALVGASTACFALVTNATQREIVQCVPVSPTLSCSQIKGTIQQAPSGPQCCVTLQSVPSVDGTQLCARFPVLGATIIELPGLPPWGVIVGTMLLLGLGTFAAHRRAIRSLAWGDNQS